MILPGGLVAPPSPATICNGTRAHSNLADASALPWLQTAWHISKGFQHGRFPPGRKSELGRGRREDGPPTQPALRWHQALTYASPGRSRKIEIPIQEKIICCGEESLVFNFAMLRPTFLPPHVYVQLCMHTLGGTPLGGMNTPGAWHDFLCHDAGTAMPQSSKPRSTSSTAGEEKQKTTGQIHLIDP